MTFALNNQIGFYFSNDNKIFKSLKEINIRQRLSNTKMLFKEKPCNI